MAKIKDIGMLRDHAIMTLEQLSNGEIDTAQAGVSGKLCEGVIATVKAELEYARMLGQEPNIPFMRVGENATKLIDGNINKALPSPIKKK